MRTRTESRKSVGALSSLTKTSSPPTAAGMRGAVSKAVELNGVTNKTSHAAWCVGPRRDRTHLSFARRNGGGRPLDGKSRSEFGVFFFFKQKTAYEIATETHSHVEA